MEEKFRLLMELYGISGEISGFNKITNGNINETYYVLVDRKQYIFQKINTYVFKDPVAVMNNITMVDNFIRNNDKKSSCKIISFLINIYNKNYLITGGGEFWRVCIFENNSVTFNVIENPAVLRSAGYAFGEFLNVISDFPADKLNITIPDFHNTKKRLDDFFKTVSQDENGRAKEVRDEIAAIERNYDFCCRLNEMTDAGLLPLRPVHNDTKYNNILLDKDTLKPVCVLDLDTIMPGLAAHDFGDAIRFAANKAAEDEINLDKVRLDLGYFTEFTQGFIDAAGGYLTGEEAGSLALGAPIITFELASRFLADYIDGDKYFTIRHKRHNLDRARCQLKLAADMLENLSLMSEVVNMNYAKRNREA